MNQIKTLKHIYEHLFQEETIKTIHKSLIHMYTAVISSFTSENIREISGVYAFIEL